MTLSTLIYNPDAFWSAIGVRFSEINTKTLGVLMVIIVAVSIIIILMVIFAKAKKRDNYTDIINTTISMDEHKNVMSDVSSSTGVDPDADNWAEAKNEIPTKTSQLETTCNSSHKQCITY